MGGLLAAAPSGMWRIWVARSSSPQAARTYTPRPRRLGTQAKCRAIRPASSPSPAPGGAVGPSMRVVPAVACMLACFAIATKLSVAGILLDGEDLRLLQVGLEVRRTHLRLE